MVHISIKIVTDFLTIFMINVNCDPQKGKSEPKSKNSMNHINQINKKWTAKKPTIEIHRKNDE